MLLAKHTRLAIRMYAHAKDSKPVKYSSVLEILNAINGLLEDRGISPVTLDDLTLTIE